MKKANTLAEIHQSCHPEPLQRDQLEAFFVDTAQARDRVMSRRDEIGKRLQRGADVNTKLLLAGHGGCGKSTELVKLADELADTFFPVSFSVAQECNLYSVVVEDVLLVVMERVLSACKATPSIAKEMADAHEALREVYRWFATELEIEETKIEAGGEAEAGINTSQSYLGKLVGLLVKCKASIRRGDSRTYRATQETPQRLGALVDRCNLVIKEVKQILHGMRKHLLIVIEDLDKVGLMDARRIFLKQPGVLAELDTCMVCTVPVFLHHSPDRGALEQHFECVDLPMLKVREFDGTPCESGRSLIRQIVDRRVDRSLIEGDALELLITKSGGVLRDVFEVLVVAGEAAESLSENGQQEAVITEANVRYGLNRRKSEYARAISVLDLPKEWDLTSEDLYRKLREMAPSPVRALPSEPTTMVLLKARAIIEYNGEAWFWVHPLVEELLKVMPEAKATPHE